MRHSRRGVAAAVLASLATAAGAMRVSDIEEYATLTVPALAQLGDRSCMAAAGSTVRIIGRPTSPGEAAPSRLLFVGIVDGGCAGYRLSVAEDRLADFRESVEPAAAPSFPAPGKAPRRSP